jgi:hypothetical protein
MDVLVRDLQWNMDTAREHACASAEILGPICAHEAANVFKC